VHSPLGIPAQGNYIAPQRIDRGVHSADRVWDALAMLLILAGTTLFLMARSGLASLAAGTQKLPPGVTSYVQRADYFSAQSSLGLLLIGIGVAIGLGSTIRHALRRRAAEPRPAAAAPASPAA
jgi:hypothetical protein